MNNFEKIKAMDIDEMAELIKGCDRCVFADDIDACNDNRCTKGHKQWLESEVRE